METAVSRTYPQLVGTNEAIVGCNKFTGSDRRMMDDKNTHRETAVDVAERVRAVLR
jgi:hypothetical protein